MLPLFEKVLNRAGIAARQRQPSRHRNAGNRPILEILEDRTLPAVNLLSQYTGLAFHETQGFIPPDTCGAAGPVNYVETVNQTIRISNKSSGVTVATDTFSDFFYTQGGLPKADAQSILFDPVVVWDNQIQRFIVGDQDANFSTHVSRFHLAISKTATPGSLTSADWYFGQVNTTETGYDADYPGNFGFNHDALVFTLNMFPAAGGNFHVQVNSVKISDLVNGTVTAFRNNVASASLRPTVMHDAVANDPMWLVSEANDKASLNVVKMTNVLSNSAGFFTTNVSISPYSAIVHPRQPDGTEVVGNIDSRIMNAAEWNGRLVATHAVAIGADRDVARWYLLDVSSGSPSLLDQGNVTSVSTGAGSANVYDYYPGVDINAVGDIGMSFMQSSTNAGGFMSVYVTGRTVSDPAGTMQTPILVQAGATNYHDFAPQQGRPQRAGDLSGISVDTDGSFWIANEYANTDASANWGTVIAHFSLGGGSGAPLNDNFANGVLISGSTAALTGTNAAATKETGEPDHAGDTGGHSVWWNWTAPGSGTTTIDTIGSNFDTLLGVYIGASVSSLSTIASDNDSGGNQTSLVTFTATAGATYRIAVDGLGGATGNITLNLAGPVPGGPGNDNFSNATVISGSTATLTGANAGATKESGEPNHGGNAGGHSVWWSWTASGSGLTTIDTIGSNYDTLLGVYIGASVSSLTTIASDDDSGGNQASKVIFNATVGATYWIAVDGWGGATGNIALNLAGPTASDNDNFANASLISGSTATLTATNAAATKEFGEPNHSGNSGGHSLWWLWTAPGSGQTTIDTIGSTFDTLLGVYTGSAVFSLTTIASDDDSGGNLTSKVIFNASAGTTYAIAVDGWGGATGNINLNLVGPAGSIGPANDNFANATLVSGNTANLAGTNVAATKETGEPNHGADPGGHSVWWVWTAPTTGQTTVDTIGTGFDTLLGVYTGSAVSSLTTIASDDDSGGNRTSLVAFSAIAGTTYRIAVDGWGGATGNIALNLAGPTTAPPLNDKFRNASVDFGLSGTTTGTIVGASRQLREPKHFDTAGGHTVWWRWKPNVRALVTINTIGSDFDTLLAVYTGKSLGVLKYIAKDDDSGGNQASLVTFLARRRKTYRIAVDGWGGATGNVTLNWATFLAPQSQPVGARRFNEGCDQVSATVLRSGGFGDAFAPIGHRREEVFKVMSWNQEPLPARHFSFFSGHLACSNENPALPAPSARSYEDQGAEVMEALNFWRSSVWLLPEDRSS